MKFFRGQRYTLLASLLIVFATFLFVGFAHADNWSWSAASPTIKDKQDAGQNFADYCEQTYHGRTTSVDVLGSGNGSITPKTNCVIGEGGGYTLYSYGGGNGGLAIQFAGDKNVRAIRGIGCDKLCIYVPSRDWLLSIVSTGYPYVGPIGIYTSFVSGLHLENELSLEDRYYTAHNSSPDALIGNFSDKDGYIGYVGHMQRSDNDKWLVAEFGDEGLMRIDMDTFQAVKFSDWKPNYYNNGPHTELAISNDGQRVAVFGQNSLNDIFDIPDSCGTRFSLPATVDVMNSPQVNPCPYLNLYGNFGDPATNTIMPNLQDTYMPQFDDQGGEITFYATSYDSSITPKRITLWASGYAGPRLKYLALGDSISSGEGDTDHNPATGAKYYRLNTDSEEDAAKLQPREKCHQSTRSYPYLLAADMSLSMTDWNSVACSNATAYDAFNIVSDGLYAGQAKGGRFPWSQDGNVARLLGYTNKNNLQVEALTNFVPGRVAQARFVSKYKPKVITITMGANDIGFAGKLQECVLPGRFGFPSTCEWATTKKAELAKIIQNEYDDLVSLYKQLYFASSNQAKMYVIGYPNLISDTDPGNCGLNAGSLDLTERQMIVQATDYLNLVIEHAADAAGAKYIDISRSLDGGRLCDSGQKDVNGIETWGDTELQESFHPNAHGHIDIENQIEKDINYESMLTYSDCPTAATSCPKTDGSEAKPAIPAYFGGSSDSYKNTQLTSDSATKGKSTTVSLRKYEAQPGDTMQAVLHSDPVDLGQYTVATDGSLNVSLTIPNTVPAGYHELTLSGHTYSGEPIIYTQTILITGSDPNDIDENGVSDKQQACGPFILASGVDNNLNGIDDACDPMANQTKPPAPIGLSAVSPTNTNPNLTWAQVAGAKSYNVYRDNTLLGNTNSASYVDTNASEGIHNYYVTTLNSNNIESDHSNVVSVFVDRTKPSVSTPKITGFGAISLFGLTAIVLPSNMQVVLSGNASDVGSGIAGGEYYVDSDPGIGHGTPMMYSNGGITAQVSTGRFVLGYHYIYIRAKDNAGNWSSQTSKALVYL